MARCVIQGLYVIPKTDREDAVMARKGGGQVPIILGRSRLTKGSVADRGDSFAAATDYGGHAASVAGSADD
nr:hypothetical protein [Pseudarthrobacter sp. ATCC 49987]